MTQLLNYDLGLTCDLPDGWTWIGDIEPFPDPRLPSALREMLDALAGQWGFPWPQTGFAFNAQQLPISFGIAPPNALGLLRAGDTSAFAKLVGSSFGVEPVVGSSETLQSEFEGFLVKTTQEVQVPRQGQLVTTVVPMWLYLFDDPVPRVLTAAGEAIEDWQFRQVAASIRRLHPVVPERLAERVTLKRDNFELTLRCPEGWQVDSTEHLRAVCRVRPMVATVTASPVPMSLPEPVDLLLARREALKGATVRTISVRPLQVDGVPALREEVVATMFPTSHPHVPMAAARLTLFVPNSANVCHRISAQMTMPESLWDAARPLAQEMLDSVRVKTHE